MPYGSPIINFCNPGVHYEMPFITKIVQIKPYFSTGTTVEFRACPTDCSTESERIRFGSTTAQVLHIFYREFLLSYSANDFVL